MKRRFSHQGTTLVGGKRGGKRTRSGVCPSKKPPPEGGKGEALEVWHHK